MRFAKIHPAFIVFFLISFVGVGVGFYVSASAIDACDTPTGIKVDSQCATEAEVNSNVGTVLAIGSLAVAVTGIGFQIGRGGTLAAAPLPPQPGFPPGSTPFPQQPPQSPQRPPHQ